jgi:hypothetical protein
LFAKIEILTATAFEFIGLALVVIIAIAVFNAALWWF